MMSSIYFFLTFFLIAMASHEIGASHDIEGCQHFNSGINSNQFRSAGKYTYFVQSYRIIAVNTNDGHRCCRLVLTFNRSDPKKLNYQYLFSLTNNQIINETTNLEQTGPGVYQNASQPELVTILSDTPDDVYLYHCIPSIKLSIIIYATTKQNPNIDYKKMSAQYQKFGYAGYQNITQDPKVCTHY